VRSACSCSARSLGGGAERRANDGDDAAQASPGAVDAPDDYIEAHVYGAVQLAGDGRERVIDALVRETHMAPPICDISMQQQFRQPSLSSRRPSQPVAEAVATRTGPRP
jgi:hypothetical protein